MADGVIKNKIVVEGEAAYKREMAEINRSLREHKSAVKAAAAEMDGAEGSMLAMYQQGDALERVLEDQSTALRTMESHLDKVEATYGANSREATELRTKINNMRAEMAKTEKELRDFRTKMDDAADSMQDAEKAADGLDDDLKKIGDGAKDAKDDVGDLGKGLGALEKLDFGDLAGKLGGIAGVTGTVTAGLKIGSETVQAWNDLSAYTGKTSEALAQIKADSEAVYQKGLGENREQVTQAVAVMNQMTGLTGESLQKAAASGMALSDVFGMDIADVAMTAAQCMNLLHISAEEAFDYITHAAQQGANKNGNLLDTINEYAAAFAAGGKSAEEMFTALELSAQMGVFDLDKTGDAWNTFMTNLTKGDETAKSALEQMGFAAEDMVRKIAEGGEAADLATSDILDALANSTSPLEQNILGAALFGSAWDDTSGKVLPIFQSMSGGLDGVAGSAQKLVDIKYDDLDTAWNNLSRSLEGLASPLLTSGANALADTLNRWAGAVDAIAAGDWEGAAKALAAPSEEMQAQTEVAQQASADLRTELAALDEQINAAFASGDNVTGWQLTAQREQLLNAIQQAEVDAVAAMGEMTDAMTNEIEDAQPDMMDAGKGMGTSEVLGYESGAAGMEQAGKDAAAGAVTGAQSATGAMYDAGAALGGAFRRGFRNEMMIQSPSRAAMEDMAFVTDGYVMQAQRDRERLQEASAGLADAVRGGMRESLPAGGGTPYGAYGGAGGMSMEAAAQAMRHALSGMGLYLGTERLGELLEPGVSRSTTRRAALTIKGQSAAVKNL